MGYSVGRWEGDTLVVESNGYTDRSWLDFDGHPHTEELRITERYTRRDIGHIDVQVTMVDPKTYAKPIAFSMPMELQADTEILEGFCENHQEPRAHGVHEDRAGGQRAGSDPVALCRRLRHRWRQQERRDVTLTGSTLWFDYDGKGRRSCSR